jgi:hypothetical protein
MDQVDVVAWVIYVATAVECALGPLSDWKVNVTRLKGFCNRERDVEDCSLYAWGACGDLQCV